MRRWNFTGDETYRAEPHSGRPVTGLVAINGDKYFAVSSDSTMTLNSILNDKPLFTFYGHVDSIFGVEWDKNSKILTFGNEHHWKIWKFTQNMKPMPLRDYFL